MAPPRSWIATILVVLVLAAGCSGPIGVTSTPTPTAGDKPTATTTETSAGGSPTGTLEVHYINVGQSVATLIVSPSNETMLIDSGDYKDDGKYVLQYLKNHGIERIDHFVVSHNDADHIGGNAAIIEYYETEANGIGAVYDPGIAASTKTYEEYLDTVERYNVTLYETREGDHIPFAGVNVTVMGPPEPYLENGARNENSIVLKLEHGDVSFLFTGDAEDTQEQYLVEHYGSALQATVMKAGHHGSKGSTSGALLDAADPKTVVISSAYDSRYGHPHEEVLERLANRSIRTYWTAVHGDIVLRSNGSAVSVYSQRPASTNPLELRSADPIAPESTDGVEYRTTIPVRPDPDGSTPTQTTTATPGEESPSRLSVSTIHADAAGVERENLNDEYITFRNEGAQPLELSGWTISDAAGNAYSVPSGVIIEPNETITLHTGTGSNNQTNLYWGSGSPIWNNDGDTITVTNADGTVVLTESYS